MYINPLSLLLKEWYPYRSVSMKEIVIKGNNGTDHKVERELVTEQLFVTGQIYGGAPLMRLKLEDGVMSGAKCFKNEQIFEGQVSMYC